MNTNRRFFEFKSYFSKWTDDFIEGTFDVCFNYSLDNCNIKKLVNNCFSSNFIEEHKHWSVTTYYDVSIILNLFEYTTQIILLPILSVTGLFLLLFH